MFSKTCEYAIRAMLFIAQKSKDGTKVGIKEIASKIDSPEHFIAKILQDLCRKKLLLSTKGPNGGFYLDEKTSKSSLADVVRTVDGDEVFTGCGLGLKKCSESQPCPIHNEFKLIRNNLEKLLTSTRVDNFNDALESGLTFLKR